MSLALDDLSRDPDQLLRHLQQMAEVIARQNASLASLQAERDTVLVDPIQRKIPKEQPSEAQESRLGEGTKRRNLSTS